MCFCLMWCQRQILTHFDSFGSCHPLYPDALLLLLHTVRIIQHYTEEDVLPFESLWEPFINDLNLYPFCNAAFWLLQRDVEMGIYWKWTRKRVELRIWSFSQSSSISFSRPFSLNYLMHPNHLDIVHLLVCPSLSLSNFFADIRERDSRCLLIIYWE